MPNHETRYVLCFGGGAYHGQFLSPWRLLIFWDRQAAEGAIPGLAHRLDLPPERFFIKEEASG